MDDDDEAEKHVPTKRLVRRRPAERRAADLIEDYLVEQRQEIDDLLAECSYLDAALAALRDHLRFGGLEPRLDVTNSSAKSVAVAIGPTRIPVWREDDPDVIITCTTDWADEEAAENDAPQQQMLRVAAQGYAAERRRLEPLRQEIITILREAGLVVQE